MKTATVPKFKETKIGTIPEGWENLALGKFAYLAKDGYLPNGDESLLYVGLEHIDQQTLSLNSIGRSFDVTSNKFRFRNGDVLFGKLRPYFRKVYRPNFSGICSTDIWVVRAKEGFDQGWLFYLFASEDFINSASGGSGGTRMPRADWNHLKDTIWPVPKLLEQKQIAEILSSLDDKIELNRRINANLEAIASALFKKWFVDACPVGPDGRVGDKLPEGWKMGKLREEFEIIMGQSPSGDTYNEIGEGLPFYQGRTDFGFRFPARRIFCTDPKRKARALDTLVSVRAPVGDVNMSYEECCIGRGVGAIRKSGFPSYTFYTIKSLQKEISKFDSEGTVFGSINKDSLSNIPCVIPPQSVVVDFERLASEIDGQILNLSKEVENLENTRDSLLPRLMNGRIRAKV